VPPPAVYLSDDFDGAVDTTRWQVYTNGGSATTGGGRLNLSAPSGSVRFPYVHAKGSPFPAAGDFRLRVELQYTNSTWSGTGVVAGTELPANGVTELEKNRPDVFFFSVWQDNNMGLVVAYGGAASSSTTVYQGGRPDTGRHTVVLRYVDGAYQVMVDGQQVYQSPPTDARPAALWFGNPVVLSADNPLADLNWTGLGIDHVSIEQLP